MEECLHGHRETRLAGPGIPPLRLLRLRPGRSLASRPSLACQEDSSEPRAANCATRRATLDATSPSGTASGSRCAVEGIRFANEQRPQARKPGPLSSGAERVGQAELTTMPLTRATNSPARTLTAASRRFWNSWKSSTGSPSTSYAHSSTGASMRAGLEVREQLRSDGSGARRLAVHGNVQAAPVGVTGREPAPRPTGRRWS